MVSSWDPYLNYLQRALFQMRSYLEVLGCHIFRRIALSPLCCSVIILNTAATAIFLSWIRLCYSFVQNPLMGPSHSGKNQSPRRPTRPCVTWFLFLHPYLLLFVCKEQWFSLMDVKRSERFWDVSWVTIKKAWLLTMSKRPHLERNELHRYKRIINSVCTWCIWDVLEYIYM